MLIVILLMYTLVMSFYRSLRIQVGIEFGNVFKLSFWGVKSRQAFEWILMFIAELVYLKRIIVVIIELKIFGDMWWVDVALLSFVPIYAPKEFVLFY